MCSVREAEIDEATMQIPIRNSMKDGRRKKRRIYMKEHTEMDTCSPDNSGVCEALSAL